MKNPLILLLLTLFIFASCKNKGKTVNEAPGLPYQVNLEQGINNIRPVPVSNLGKGLEYIPLETDPSIMLSRVSAVFLDDSLIYVTDGGRLLLFDRRGKYIKQIGSAGRGPGEYSRVADFIVDKDAGEIYILSSRIVLVYDMQGNLKRNFAFDFPSSQFIVNDRNTLLYHQFNVSRPSEDTVFSWFVTDRNGIMQSKIVNDLKRVSMPGLIVPTSPLYSFKGLPHFLEYGIDTLYYFNNSAKEQYAVFNTGKIKMEPDLLLTNYKEETERIKNKIWISGINENDNLLFIKLSWGLTDSVSYCTFNKKSSELTVLQGNGFDNDLDGGLIFWPEEIINNNILIDYADAFDLLKSLKKLRSGNPKVTGKGLSDQLIKLENQLTETSNPVLIIIKQQALNQH